MTPVAIAAPSPVHVQDRRSGERIDIVTLEFPVLDRHEIDDLYGAALGACPASDAVVLTGARPEVLADDFYERLIGDIIAHGVAVFADMHGSSLEATLAGGANTALKISEDDLAADGCATGSEAQAIELARDVSRRGPATVVVSRAGSPAIAVVGDQVALRGSRLADDDGLTLRKPLGGRRTPPREAGWR